MAIHKLPQSLRAFFPAILAIATAVAFNPTASAQLFENLSAFGLRPDVGDPSLAAPRGEGPKGIATADFDADGTPDLAVSNLDGSVTILLGTGKATFATGVHLQTGAVTLRGIVAADLDGDGDTDIATAAPADGFVGLFFNEGGTFGDVTQLASWFGARDLIDGDFDGDGLRDLVVGGPDQEGKGLRQYRGTGDGKFEEIGDDNGFGRQGYPYNLSFRPVHALETIRSRDGLRDDLIVTTADSDRTWILSGKPLELPAKGAYFNPSMQNDPGDLGIAADSPLMITEFMAVNRDGLADADGTHPDWIEVYNRSTEPVDLSGWHLTDIANRLDLWAFPASTLSPGQFLVVFASSKNRADPEEPHANFKLSGSGEYLALVKPDGLVAHQFGGAYPPQIGNHSYGISQDGEPSYFDLPSPGWENNAGSRNSNGFIDPIRIPEIPPIVTAVPIFGSGAEWRFLDDGSDQGSDWKQPGFIDSTWGSGASPLGYGDDQIATVIGFGGVSTRKHITTYFRKLVNIPDANRFQRFLVRLQRDDGAIIYVNGVEVIRSQMPEGPIAFFTRASGGAGEDSIYEFEIDGSYFSKGLNLIAVELHQQYPGSHDLLLDMSLDGLQVEDLNPEPEVLEDGILRVVASIPNQGSRSMAIGTLVSPADSGRLDLVTVNRDSGQIEIRHGNYRHNFFDHQVAQSLDVPGGPRAVEIVDLDLDGWNDLVVALRNFDRVVTFKNEQGELRLNSEMPAGVSPREMAIADFDGNGTSDVAVINRGSADLSILATFAGEASFAKLDQIYPTDGEVTSIFLEDLNRDGRDDVVQLHRASGDFSIRFAGPGGQLGEPEYFVLGGLPSAMEVVDVNHDGFMDVMSANLGGRGSVSLRLGDGNGEFSDERVFTLPENEGGGLYALTAADFDNDGNIDLAAGHADCRLTLFKGDGAGGFTKTTTQFFVYEARVMVSGDFDQDGDTDLAGAGWRGTVVVLENDGNLLDDPNPTRYEYAAEGGWDGTKGIRTVDFNGDSDLDLAIGSGSGLKIYLGTAGMGFEYNETVQLVYDFDDAPVSDLGAGDFDGDGVDDLAVTCRLLSCITILKRNENGKFVPSITVDVPSGGLLASGDLDGDGFDDLVGSGDTLWVALSSRKTEQVPYEPESSAREAADSVVINEILPRNNDIRIDQAGGKKVDFVELYNPPTGVDSLGGWSLRLEATDDLGTPVQSDFTLPASEVLPGDHVMVYFGINRRSDFHTGFKLPGNGGKLTLLDANNEIVDAVDYPALEANISYSRYADGLSSFVYDNIPSPGRTNRDNGPVAPVLDLESFDLTSLRDGRSIPLRAIANDDVGIVNVSLLYRTVGEVNPETHRLILYDDGMHDDGRIVDGYFANLLPALESGEAIQYYFEATDLSGRVVTIPDDPRFVESGEPVEMFSLGIAESDPLRITEVVTDNENGLRDEGRGTPDYIEILNTSDQPLSLDGLSVARSLQAGTEDVFTFPPGTLLDPGEFVIVFADGNLTQGDLHAPFRIGSTSDRIVLFRTGADGARRYIDGIDTGSMGRDEALFRAPGADDLWLIGSPSPYVDGIGGNQVGLGFDLGGDIVLYHTFATEPGLTYIPEFSNSLAEGSWQALPAIDGDGTVKTASKDLSGTKGFFRIRSSAGQ